MATLEETAISATELDVNCKWCNKPYSHEVRLKEVEKQNQKRGLTEIGSAPNYCCDSCWISSVRVD